MATTVGSRTALSQVNGGPYSYRPLGYQQVSASAVAQNLPNIPPNASVALIAVESQGIRYRDDGIAPTASVGMPISGGQDFQYMGDLINFQFIAQTGSPTVDILYYM